jgi:heme a synthase
LTSAELHRNAPDMPAVADDDRPIAYWLLACCAMIFAMVVIGGITRLTESGLSIAEWRPLAGILPPLSEADWHRVFDLYRQIPEYELINRGMSLAEFKEIFWWEYIHRLWGRLIGFVFALPFLYFLIRGRIRRRLLPHLLVMFALGGLQGLLGWYMVQSGLSVRTDVSQYRLTAHLGAALAIHAYIFWIALTLLRPVAPAQTAPGAAGLRRHLKAVTGLAVLTLLFGGLVAGLNAGLIYNTFPLMDGQLVPDGLLFLEPAWINLFENPETVQFVHRVLAITLVAATLWLWIRARSVPLAGKAHLALHLLAGMALVQASLGVATLLLVVPIPLAAAHQGGAVVLLTLILWALHEMRGAR